MKSFLVGLLVIVLMGLFSVFAVVLFPLLLVLGFFLRYLLGIALIVFAIWLIGKFTLLGIDLMKKRKMLSDETKES